LTDKRAAPENGAGNEHEPPDTAVNLGLALALLERLSDAADARDRRSDRGEPQDERPGS